MQAKPQQKLTVCWSNAMFGGKTEEAGIRAAVAEHTGKKWTLIRPSGSTRGEETLDKLITHGGRYYPAVSASTAAEAKSVAMGLVETGWDLIWIDEPFLFPDKENVADFVFTILERCDVLISTLSRTSEGDWWPCVGEILSKADRIVDCRRAVCEWCKNEATRTVCIVEKNGKDKTGGSESYKSACVECWNREAAKCQEEKPSSS